MKQDMIDFLSERRSIRNFDSHDDISIQEINTILSLVSKAPSGNNIQPWKVVTVKNKNIQKKIQSLAFNQKQVGDASAIFFVFGNPDEYDIEKQIDDKMKHEQLTEKSASIWRQKMELFYEMSPSDKGIQGLTFDCGLFAMNLLYTIRAYGYEAVPMRGANFDKIKNLLAVPHNWVPIVMIPFGKGIEKGNPTSRKLISDFSVIIE